MSAQHVSKRNDNSRGISLIEVLIVVIAVGLLASIAMRSMTALLKDAKHVATEREMEMLAKAIVGDPSIMAVAGGVRSDFGYVGDVGALPSNLNALETNPGYSTWNGPYVSSTSDRADGDFRKDAWGVDYSYDGGVTITSTGSGSDIVKQFADSSTDLLSNTVWGIVRDASDVIPPVEDTIDIDVVIIYPDGTGGMDTITSHPTDTGFFFVESVPIGRHPLMVIYTPEVDTLLRYVTVMPRHSSADLVYYNFDTAYFSDPDEGYVGLTFVEDSDTLTGASGACNNLRFWVTNGTDESIQISSITLEYTATAYYSYLDYEDDEDYEFSSPSDRNGSGDVVTFSPVETIPSFASKVIEVSGFKTTQAGNGDTASMLNETITVTFSDGSSMDITFDYCE